MEFGVPDLLDIHVFFGSSYLEILPFHLLVGVLVRSSGMEFWLVWSSGMGFWHGVLEKGATGLLALRRRLGGNGMGKNMESGDRYRWNGALELRIFRERDLVFGGIRLLIRLGIRCNYGGRTRCKCN